MEIQKQVNPGGRQASTEEQGMEKGLDSRRLRLCQQHSLLVWDGPLSENSLGQNLNLRSWRKKWNKPKELQRGFSRRGPPSKRQESPWKGKSWTPGGHNWEKKAAYRTFLKLVQFTATKVSPTLIWRKARLLNRRTWVSSRPDPLHENVPLMPGKFYFRSELWIPDSLQCHKYKGFTMNREVSLSSSPAFPCGSLRLTQPQYNDWKGGTDISIFS